MSIVFILCIIRLYTRIVRNMCPKLEGKMSVKLFPLISKNPKFFMSPIAVGKNPRSLYWE